MAQLQVLVVEAKNLTKKDKLSQNDPYVELYFDDKYLKQKTKTKHNSKLPRWNETIVLNHLSGQDVLNVEVYDEDSVKDEKIGSAKVDLRPLYEKGHMDEWFELIGKDGSTTNSEGQIHLILDFERLQV